MRIGDMFEVEMNNELREYIEREYEIRLYNLFFFTLTKLALYFPKV